MSTDKSKTQSRDSLHVDMLAGDGTVQYTVHQFLVDFLGSLLPGLLFLSALLLSVIPTTQAFICVLSDQRNLQPVTSYLTSALRATENTPNVLWIGLFLFYCALGYVIGTHFQRQDPKRPDRESFAMAAYKVNYRHRLRLFIRSLVTLFKREPPSTGEASGTVPQRKWKNFRKALWNLLFLRCASTKLALVFRSKARIRDGAMKPNDEQTRKNRISQRRRDFACTSIRNCQFPYPYIRDYLMARGHDHLIDMIPWGNKGEERSKTFINRVKIRLQYYRSNAYRRIIKNEADVRLSTSMWYAAEALVAVSLVCICVSFVSLCISFFLDKEHTPVYLVAMFCPIAVLLFSWFSIHATQASVHYQRLREVFYVLETAYTAFRYERELMECPRMLESANSTIRNESSQKPK